MNINFIHFDLKWDGTKRDEFRDNFDYDKIDEFERLIDDTNPLTTSQQDINTINSKLKAIFIETAKTTGLYKRTSQKKRIKINKIHRPWFDQECLDARHEYHRIKNKLQKVKTLKNIAQLKNEAAMYKKVISRKKLEYQKSLNSKLKDNRKHNP